MARDEVIVLDVGQAGARLRIGLEERLELIAPGAERWFDASFIAEAHPFAGSLVTVVTESDVEEWADQFDGLASGSGTAQLGGSRQARLTLATEAMIGDEATQAVEVELTPNADDPYPTLRFILLGVQTRWRDTSETIRSLLG